MKFVSIAATLVMGSGLCFAQSQPPSLADIARQNQAVHGEKKARKVITNDDLEGRASANPGAAAAASNATAPGRDSGGPDATRAPDSGLQTKDPKRADSKSSAPAPQHEVQRLKKELDSLKAQQEGWKSSARRYEDKLAAETSEFRRAMYQDALANDRQNVTLYQRKIEDAESKLASAEQAASKAGAPPEQTGDADKSHL